MEGNWSRDEDGAEDNTLLLEAANEQLHELEQMRKHYLRQLAVIVFVIALVGAVVVNLCFSAYIVPEAQGARAFANTVAVVYVGTVILLLLEYPAQAQLRVLIDNQIRKLKAALSREAGSRLEQIR